MKATANDLRRRLGDVLKAVDRNEEVSIVYRGKVRGKLRPVAAGRTAKVQDHGFFNMVPDDSSVEEQMNDLRGGRFRAV